MSIIGGIISGASSLLGTGANIVSNVVTNKKNREYQQDMTEKAWAREDTAIQRRATDMEAAGINPLLAAGSADSVGGSAQMANTVQGQAPDVGGIIANTGNMAADTMKKTSEAKENMRFTAFERGNEESRREMINQEIRNLRITGDMNRQNIANLMATEQETYQNIVLKEAQQELFAAQTNREREEAIKLALAGQLISEQIKTELQQHGINEQMFQKLFEDTEIAHSQSAILAQQLRLVTQQTRIAEINSRWLEEEKIQELTNNQMHAISSMISAVGGLFSAAGGGTPGVSSSTFSGSIQRR